jgi:Tol biopolymer transport system component
MNGWSGDGKKSTYTAEIISDSSGADMYPQWSRDGKKLLFTSNRTGNRDLMVLSLEQ